LPKKLLAEVDRRAKKLGVSRSFVIRDALELYLGGALSMNPIQRVADLLGALSGGPADLGENHREHMGEIVRDRR
jgi:hypothetical protein